MTRSSPMLGGVELGGTKCVCIIGTGPGDIRMNVAIPTGDDPLVTLGRIETAMHDGEARHGPIQALGIASFGPLDLDRNSRTFGCIMTTTKPGWRNAPVAGRLGAAFPVSLGFDTDVNGAALAEGRWGAARDLRDFAYVTVGTGIGVGLVTDGRPIRGFTHGELGHIRIARMRGDVWPGSCRFHRDCLEGLASGPAIEARTGLPAGEIPPGSPAWEYAAHALAQLLHTLVLTTAPRRILVGGGVAERRPELIHRARILLLESLNGYIALESLVGPVEEYVVRPGLGSLAGPLGALALAAGALYAR